MLLTSCRTEFYQCHVRLERIKVFETKNLFKKGRSSLFASAGTTTLSLIKINHYTCDRRERFLWNIENRISLSIIEDGGQSVENFKHKFFLFFNLRSAVFEYNSSFENWDGVYKCWSNNVRASWSNNAKADWRNNVRMGWSNNVRASWSNNVTAGWSNNARARSTGMW